jgi:hypothetical protein
MKLSRDKRNNTFSSGFYALYNNSSVIIWLIIILKIEDKDKTRSSHTWWTCPSISTGTIKSAFGTGLNDECTSVSSRSITKQILTRSLTRNVGNKHFSLT